jgi:putative restriction endonuclease
LATDLLEKIQKLNIWTSGDQRAPHKPLLLLIALSRIANGEGRLVPFSEIEKTLEDLLRDFGPSRKSYHPEYPFWWLQNDGIWEVPGGEKLPKRKMKNNPTKSTLLKYEAKAGFTPEAYEQLKADRKLLVQVALDLLDAHFPSSIHKDILDRIGLDLADPNLRKKRDPRFRFDVIQAYEHRCAVCGYDAKIGNSDLGLEAAHIKWVQASGPDNVNNGLALCALHHKAFDLGAWGLSDELKIILSADIHGREHTNHWFFAFNNQPLRKPHSSMLVPAIEYLKWHRKEVFRSPARA